MGKLRSLLLVGIGLCILLSGCATVISKEIIRQANREISVGEVAESPDIYKGEVVIWGGEIVDAENRKEGTVLEVLEKPIDMTLRPKEVDQSSGRFLAVYDGYLDVAIYAPGREVTVAGEIRGERVLPLGEIEYAYPLITVNEIYLWSPRKEAADYPYRYYPPWYYAPYEWWY